MNFQEIRSKLEAIDGTKIKPLDDEKASKLSDEFSVPEDYVAFLRNVGYGRIGNSQFQFFDGVAFVDEIFGYETPETENVLLFGDDYQGVCTGFDRNKWSVVRVLPDQTVIEVADSFDAFIGGEFIGQLSN
jgi:hypothetical protein